tara:strand:+ start:699 stop:1394 length:696 start_codon:yes stop_codon:yes gene_type:complete
MNRLEKIVGVPLLAISIGLGIKYSKEIIGVFPFSSSNENSRSVVLSNGMSVYGWVETEGKGDNKKTIIHNRHYTVHDEGPGNVYAVDPETGRRATSLTYEWAGKDFPIWEPFAFREGQHYWDAANAFLARVIHPHHISVLEGDTLWDIAEEMFDDGMRWEGLYRENNVDELQRKHPGSTNITRDMRLFDDNTDFTRDLQPGQRLRVFLTRDAASEYTEAHPEREMKVIPYN